MLTVLATRAGAPLETLLFWRYAVAGVLLACVARRAGRRLAPFSSRARSAATFLVVGAAQAAVAFLGLLALRWISAATLGFLFYTFPAWVALFAALRGPAHDGERIDGRKLAALALSLAGIACTVGAPGGAAGAATAWPGYALALAAALVYALLIPYLGRLQAEASGETVAALMSCGAALYLGVGALVRGTLLAPLTPASWGVVAVLSLVCTVAAFLAFLRGLAGLGPVRTAIVSTVEPFWTALLGAVVLAQPLTPPALAGGALIAAAVLLLQLRATPRQDACTS